MISSIRKSGRFLAVSVLAFIAFSCSNDAPENILQEEQVQKQTLSQAEINTILETDGLSSIADKVIQEIFDQGQSGKTAKNDDCYQADFSDTGFTVRFDNCSLEEGGEELNGTISAVYENKNGVPSLYVTFDNLMVGETSMSGTRGYSYGGGGENSATVNIASDMSITEADGSITTEKGTKIWTVALDEEFENGVLTIDGEWIVEANGNTYSISITELLEVNLGCDYIGNGIMLVNKNGFDVSIDFGDGSCDDKATLTYPDGTTEEISLQ